MDRGWESEADGRRGVRALLVLFSSMLRDMSANHKCGKFDDIETQCLLKDADWDNELHPTPDGFANVAAEFLTALRKHFGDRI